MYQRYADLNSWKFDILSISETGLKGVKEAICNISGLNVFSKLKFESGVHRVQRVPTTESSGRVHTSAATVAVLPEAEEVDIEVLDKDLRIDVFRSSGPGGQSVNTTDSAVRITHIPTGIVVSQQDEKSQHKNKAKALKILRSRLLDNQIQEKNKERSEQRKNQVGSGDRSERIRTYNFPQGRVTDHRINLTLHKLAEFMEGEIFDEVIDDFMQIFTSRGFAYAASNFRRQGLIIKDGIDDTEALRAYFSKKYGKPNLCFITGHSMGGIISLASVEKFPAFYDGALPLCGWLAPVHFLTKRGLDMLSLIHI